MTDPKNYIPANKFDFPAVERLKAMPFKAVKNDVNQLLEWLQDMNWPIAGDIADYLIPHIGEITDDLLSILNGDDSMWKYWIIGSLLARSTKT